MISILVNTMFSKTVAGEGMPAPSNRLSGPLRNAPALRIGYRAAAGLVIYAALLYYVLHNHMMWRSVLVWLGLIALPFLTTIRPGNTGHARYGYWAAMVALLCCWLPVNTLFYEATFLSVFFVIETFVGRINTLPLLITTMLSPVFQFVANVFTFPLRLKLTALAGAGMKLMGSEVAVHGNMIALGGHEFTVDPACMGLNMIITSLLLQVVLIALYQKKTGRQANGWQIGWLLALSFILNLVANLLRIVMLVQFNMPPGTTMHEVMGLLCWIVYVVLPSVLITRWAMKRVVAPVEVVPPSRRTGHKPVLLIAHLLLAGLMGVAAHTVKQRHQPGVVTVASVPVAGYRQQIVGKDVLKLENEQSLVYIKPIESFYSADHNPMICWRGSGYELKETEEAMIGQQPVYLAALRKDNDRLYTAWWYDNGTSGTIGQWEWRWDVLKNKRRYSLVNVTATTRTALEKEIIAIRSAQRFKAVIQEQH